MERILFRFTKGDLIRFVGHLDLMRMMERAMRRSGFPIRYTEGFNPRPRMSFASALTLGATSAGELCQLDLAQDLDAETVAAGVEGLRRQLPTGLAIQEVWEIPLEKRNPYIQVEAAEYELTFAGPEANSRVKRYLNEGPGLSAALDLAVEERDEHQVWMRIKLPAGERAAGTGVRIRDVVAGIEKGMQEVGAPGEVDAENAPEAADATDAADESGGEIIEIGADAGAAPVRLTRLHRTGLWCEQTPERRI